MHSRIALGPPPTLASLIAEQPAALFLDFDGTLVELAPGPDAIEPRAGLARELSKLADRLEGRCALVSGRGVSDIEQHLGSLDIAVAGSHGSDMRRRDGTVLGQGALSLPAEIDHEMRAFATSNMIDYEDKPHGAALHYRSNPEAGEAARSFAEQLADRHGWAAQHGKSVVEIVAKSANKGAAVAAFMAEEPFAGARPIFIGDDLTDEAGFSACAKFGGAGILVGTRPGTGAQYSLPDVQSVHEWLEL
ncbi:trehalose-phosphatase [Erythrobacter rubeus]|uniref:Trehalose 6-phosphate phosphatase n=1 Tax=Erythrobacter rubeus TaxID=2760803 RepID=A0ABR8KUL1_9SPHN|nr:trehalose-phosphatase [Erythrobacter rubeus]MBD2842119.1 trehalose-phosphatase [Erythrobacter rubeus]